jgi:hypothetical protein
MLRFSRALSTEMRCSANNRANDKLRGYVRPYNAVPMHGDGVCRGARMAAIRFACTPPWSPNMALVTPHRSSY